MKYVNVLLLSTILFISLLFGCNKSDHETEFKNIVNSHGSFIVYSLEDLQEEALVIARVKVLDSISSENSHMMHSNVGGMTGIGGFYSERRVEVIEYYKNELDPNAKELVIRDAVALEEDGTLHTINENRPIEKDADYIVFLTYAYEDVGLGIMSADNGVFALENPGESRFSSLQEEVLAEYNQAK